jgi:hypothetical protein
MPRDEGIDVRKPAQAYNAPAWKNKPARKQKDDEVSNDPQPTQPTRYNPTGETQQPFTPPKWWNTLSNNVSNWIDNNVSGSQYVPAGLSQPQRPTTATQFKPPIWGGNPMQVSEPFDPTLPTGTFFAGGSTQDGTRLVPTGQNTSLLLGGGGIRNKGTVRIAKGIPIIGAPSQSSTTNSGGYGGTTYKKKGGSGGYGGYSYDTRAYSSDRVPSWLMNLNNWNFKG